jgi:hypothetical protein
MATAPFFAAVVATTDDKALYHPHIAKAMSEAQ